MHLGVEVPDLVGSQNLRYTKDSQLLGCRNLLWSRYTHAFESFWLQLVARIPFCPLESTVAARILIRQPLERHQVFMGVNFSPVFGRYLASVRRRIPERPLRVHRVFSGGNLSGGIAYASAAAAGHSQCASPAAGFRRAAGESAWNHARRVASRRNPELRQGLAPRKKCPTSPHWPAATRSPGFPPKHGSRASSGIQVYAT